MNRWLYLGATLLLLIFLGGCSEYVEDYYYAPRPAVAAIASTPPQQAATQPVPPPVAMTFASVIGIRREDRNQGIPASVQIRLRLENRAAQTVVFDPRTLELIDGALLAFPPPLVRPPQSISLAAMQSAIIDVFFPFSPGRSWSNTDLGSLQARWVTQVDGHSVAQAVDFRRLYPAYYYRRWSSWDYPPYYGWYGGVVIVRRR
jgi:hypothetical protein